MVRNSFFFILSAFLLFAGSSTCLAQKFPAASWSEITFDFGKIDGKTPVSHTFILSNTGDAKLSIVHYSFGCKCLSAKVLKTVLNPGESMNIDVTFNGHSQAPGEFKKSMRFTMNTQQQYCSIYVKGQIVESITVSSVDKNVSADHAPSDNSPEHKSIFNKVKDFLHKD